MPPSLEPWYMNLTIWSMVVGWTCAQATKFLVAIIQERRVDFTFFVSTGGMPSAHTASVCALATSAGLREGFASSLFAVAFGFALIVMFDAQSVRRAAGNQARLLNQIVAELFKEHHLSQEKLAELLGHTRVEVLVGFFVGILAALLVHGLWIV